MGKNGKNTCTAWNKCAQVYVHIVKILSIFLPFTTYEMDVMVSQLVMRAPAFEVDAGVHFNQPHDVTYQHLLHPV